MTYCPRLAAGASQSSSIFVSPAHFAAEVAASSAAAAFGSITATIGAAEADPTLPAGSGGTVLY